MKSVKLFKLVEQAKYSLWDGEEGKELSKYIFTCPSIRKSLGIYGYEDVKSIINEIAGEKISDSSTAFNSFTNGVARQGARFIWLEFLQLVAKEEGIMINLEKRDIL